MFPAFLTTLLFALSAASAGRTTRMLGSKAANVARLSLATVWLALWAHTLGQGWAGPSLVWFLLSGVVGFGLGDLALYAALPRIGARLTILLTQCLAAPVGAILEWLWLGTGLTPAQVLWGTVILGGVGWAVRPEPADATPHAHRVTGTILGVLAAIGQGGGAVITRKAYAVAQQAGVSIDGGTAAYQRILGGLCLTLAFVLVYRRVRRWRTPVGQAQATTRAHRPWAKAWPWVLVNSLAGPAVGVACYQWALAIAPTGVVLAIVATTPLAIIPFAYLLDGERPGILSLIGGLIAVIGAIALTLATH